MVDYISGQTVVTQYNQRTYKVLDLRFDLNPQSSFVTSGEKRVRYSEYYETRWKIKLQNFEQPLLECANGVFLVPELCLAIGMTERLAEQKQIFREVALAKNADAPIKIKESAQLVKQIMSQAQCIERMKNWRFFIEKECFSSDATKLDAGTILMGNQTLQTAEKSIDSRLS